MFNVVRQLQRSCAGAGCCCFSCCSSSSSSTLLRAVCMLCYVLLCSCCWPFSCLCMHNNSNTQLFTKHHNTISPTLSVLLPTPRFLPSHYNITSTLITSHPTHYITFHIIIPPCHICFHNVVMQSHRIVRVTLTTHAPLISSKFALLCA